MDKDTEFEFTKIENINLDSYEIPKYFEEILSEFIAKLIQHKPENVYLFSINYFEEKLNSSK
ncbi:conserved Plasmodium protein, unknown function [Plasmodium reichenowi]|uniref:RIIa domain-containing protein n=1 Tax=Plasmodium reichenowi TaxID=5854 RepID=A0A060RZB2_PLARE|nr:hypothetical protein PRSY57_1102400 [Plasmodium reichenowi]KYN96372.1 hypothetical protein PRSY57_1102400 [Plasmodium reichenowi]CDO64850.1 conserved Plasmodium protein, unknown function [Plasmodium reichenowi]SOV79976.1 conserved Plasmodium protein, unknown function [Plasmodium reichenowi]